MKNTAHEVELMPLSQPLPAGPAALKTVLPFLAGVKVQVTARVGSAQTTVSELVEMRQGAVLALDRLVDEPIDILVEGHIVARGLLVAIGDHFGVRLTEAPIAVSTSV